MKSIYAIAEQFDETVNDIYPLGNGLINDTFLVAAKNFNFVLQRINSQVFKFPDLIMENLITLNAHITSKPPAEVKLDIPGIIKTYENKISVYDDNGSCWRALHFIDNTESLETFSDIDEARQTGFALGHFHRLVFDLDALALHDTLPGFHIAPDYLNQYHQLDKQPSSEPSNADYRYCSDFIATFEHLAFTLENAKQQGLLSLRVIHGDPKLNNFLFDKKSRKIVSLIDLDTVKPGLIHYDIGDCMRSCCHRPENDTFDVTICAAILQSYLDEVGQFLSDPDFRFLYSAIELIPFELGLRFFTDYLAGNRYFKVTDAKQNLQRACAQFRLCESIMAQKNEIEKLIKELSLANFLS
jgi:Phosphotransferase enzyme family